MTDEAAAKALYETWHSQPGYLPWQDGGNSQKQDEARELVRLAAHKLKPPLPVQEPVGDEWTPCMKLPVVVHVRKQRPGEAHVSTREGITPVKPDDLIMRGVSGEEYPIGRAIFEQTYSLDTTPPAPQRQWVGLTEQDMPSGEDPMFDHKYFIAGLVYAAKVLQEKNND